MSSKNNRPKKIEKGAIHKEKESLLAKEKTKKIILKIVEAMLEENISKDWFLSTCTKLCQGDYNDVIQERSITNLCGYPLCSNLIKKVIKQQYHISRSTNRVYDLTERKCFCSNECYKASNFLKSQLSSVPLYMRKEEHKIIQLISDCDNKGSAGEEVVFHHKIKIDDIEKVDVEIQEQNTLSEILKEDVKNCLQHLSNLEITEKSFECSFENEGRDVAQEAAFYNSEDEVNLILDESDDDEDRFLFPNYDDTSVLSNKLMPIPDSKKKAVLISALKQDILSPSTSAKLPIDFFQHVFNDWMTEDTLKYLLGEKKFYSMKADLLFNSMVNSDSSETSAMTSVKEEYINLCIKIDNLPDDSPSDSDGLEIGFAADIGMKADAKENKPSNAVSTSNLKKRGKRKGKKPSKTVSFAPVEKGTTHKRECVKDPFDNKYDLGNRIVDNSETIQESPLREPLFPLIDSVSQNALRRQVLIGKLKSVYYDKLPLVGLHYRDIRDEILGITETFSLTPTNIIFKPKEWKCIAFILFRILTKTFLGDVEEDKLYTKFFEDATSPFNLSFELVEELVSDLIGSKQLLKLHDTKSK